MSAIIRWDPFHNLSTLQEQVNGCLTGRYRGGPTNQP
jgi:hypothetical protein